MDNDTVRSYNSLANIMENTDMQSIIDAFTEKIL